MSAATIKRRAIQPKVVFAEYGIPPSTLHFYCEKLPVKDRLPSIKLPGKRGTAGKGKRLVFVHELEAWLLKWRAKPAA